MSVTGSSTTSSGLPVNQIVRGRSGITSVRLGDGKIYNVSPEEDHGIENSFLGKYYVRLTMGKYQRPNPFKQQYFNPDTIVFLPLPTTLNDSIAIDYSNQKLETVGDFINGAGAVNSALLRTSGDLMRGIGGLVSDTAQAALRAGGAKGLAKGMDNVSNFIGNLIPAEQITTAVQQELGIAPNPNPTVAFQGPVIREFGYTWGLYPRNKKESEAITRMIKVLKMKALPKQNAGSPAIIDYPDMCQLNFFPWDEGGTGQWGWSESSIIRLKKCVITNVKVDYTSHGTPAFFEDTKLPVSYQLQLEFKEIEYMLSGDWADTDAKQFVPRGQASADFTGSILNSGREFIEEAGTIVTGGLARLRGTDAIGF